MCDGVFAFPSAFSVVSDGISAKNAVISLFLLLSDEDFRLKTPKKYSNMILHLRGQPLLRGVSKTKENNTEERAMPGIYETFGVGLMEVPVKDIIPNPHQPRKRFREKEIVQLSDSIRRVGVINPISVRYENGKYELIAGERRLRAAKLAGRYSIPCLLVTADDYMSALLSLTENMLRSDLNYFEQAQAICNILEMTEISQTQLAKELSMSQSALANKLRLLKIPPEVRRYLLDAHLKERHARALLRLDDPSKMYSAAQAASKHKMNAEQLERYIDRLLDKSSGKKKKPIFKGFCRDLRLYVNSLNHTVSVMKSNGIDTVMDKKEDENTITYTIVIKKQV